jgi:dipeptidyl aminopeptidase/acylaminoacyl peptidase
MENGAGEPTWSPDGKQLAFISRANAEELAAEDEPQPDTPPDPDEAKRRAEEKEKAEKEKVDPRVVNRFASRADTSYFDDRTAHLFVLDLDPETGQTDGQPCRLTQDGRNHSGPRWMPDGSALLATVDRQPDADDLFYYPDVVRLPLSGGDAEILTGPGTADHNPRPSPDGQWIAYNSLPVDELSTANGEIKVIPAGGGEPRMLTAGLDAHAEDFRWTPDGQSLIFLVAERGRIDLRRLPVDGGPLETLVTADREILAYDLAPDGRYVALVGWLADRTLGQVEDLWFEGTDVTPVQGGIVKAPKYDPEKQYPLVLSIHGGPHVMGSRHEATMWHEWQVQAAAGYVIFACNPRGSDGYGRDFRAALLNCWGEANLPDLQAGLEQVIAKGYVDFERLVITGGSYGGFITAWVVGHDDRFKAAVAQRGVYDLTGFYSTSDVPLLAEREFASAPWEDPAKLWKYSPLAYVERIHTPLLLIHSENDFRAPIPAAEGLFVALRQLKREVEMVRYPATDTSCRAAANPSTESTVCSASWPGSTAT